VPPLAAALLTDPPRDPDHPTQNQALRLQSHGSAMNAVFYLAAGEQPHPTVLLLHGLPGNEQNLDLAQSLRRAGYNVLTVHYRGSWGSGGTFSLTHSVEDTQAALDFLFDPIHIASYHIDAAKVIVIGHSMGGFAAVRAAAAEPRVAGVGLIAPWDISDDIGSLTVPQADFAKVAAKTFDDVDGRLGTVTSLDIAKEILADGHDWKLASSAPAIASRPILIVTATHDDTDDKAAHLIQTLALSPASRVKTVELDSDHAFSDHRIALQAEVLNWLKSAGF
jgi:pimeloyl-ACP methyl ester carboxylesterase